MRKLRFFIFLIFNSAYHDGNNDKADPYTYSIMIMLVFEVLTIFLCLEILSLFVGFDVFKTLVSLCGGARILVIALLGLVTPPTYYFFIKKKYLDRYYDEFKDAEINTKENRKNGYMCLIGYWPIWLALIIFFRMNR